LLAKFLHVTKDTLDLYGFSWPIENLEGFYAVDGWNEWPVIVGGYFSFEFHPALRYYTRVGSVFVLDFAPIFYGFEFGFNDSAAMLAVVIEAVDEFSTLMPHKVLNGKVPKQPSFALHGFFRGKFIG